MMDGGDRRIERLDDPRVAAYAHVGDAPWLESHGLFLAEGRLVVRRLLEHGRFAAESILVTPAALAAVEDLAAGTTAPTYVCDPRVLNGITGFNFHRGCLALARRGEPLPFDRLLDARVLVALEGVGNPDNVGGIFRNALAFGAGGIVLDAASGDPLYRKAIRTSMGATLRVPFARATDWPRNLERLREAGFAVVALTPRAGARDLHAAAPQLAGSRLALLLGHEGHGLTDAAMAASDVCCRIPVAPASDSLNVTVAAGIALAVLARSV